MAEYVYALHDFVPEHEDEVPFRAGERIEVVEKDDMYGDGWWQVCCSLMSTSTFPLFFQRSVRRGFHFCDPSVLVGFITAIALGSCLIIYIIPYPILSMFSWRIHALVRFL